jgi:adenylylsulfate kinase-like enzyme
VDVFVDTPIEENGMTGENAPYEPPEQAEIVIRDEPLERSAQRLLEAIG